MKVNYFKKNFSLISTFLFILSNLAFLLIFYIFSCADIERQTRVFESISDKTSLEVLYDVDLISEYEIVTESNTLVQLGNLNIQQDGRILVDCFNGSMVLFNLSKHEVKAFFLIYTVLLILFILNTLMIGFMTTDSKVNSLLKTIGNEAKMNEKTLSLLSENIHHELKTPLVVITSKLEEIKDVFEMLLEEAMCMRRRKSDKILLTSEECMNGDLDDCKSMRDFELIETHIGVVYNILDRMKNFKNMKRGGERNIYEVVEVAFRTLKMFSKNEFRYNIDVSLKKFNVVEIRNEDIINIFINHVKNSLEANSTEINVYFIDYKDGIVNTQIMDNGNGIRKNIQQDIFETNFSTKDIVDGESRGVGLFLSKHTLTTFGGDEFLIESDERGTSFGIDIPSKRRQ